MKTSLLTLIGLVALSGAAVQAQFTPGNLVVSRVGNGTVSPPNTGAPISLLEFTSGGNLTATINIPETSLQWSGTATSEGALSLSQDGKFLTVAGYVPPFTGTGALSSRTDVQAPRGYLTVGFNGTVSSPILIGAYGGNNLRSAVASNAGAYFAGGSSGTVFNNISNTTIQSTVTNTRVVKIINGKLYFSTASGTNRGVWTFDSALPTSAATASILINQGGSGDVYDFTFNSINTVAYLTNGSVLQRWTFDGSAWSLANTSGTIAAGLTGLEVAFGAGSLGQDLIYAVNPSTLFGLSFDGTSFSAATSLATAGTNYAFRGLEFSPIPEPATWILVTIGAMAIMIRRKLGPVKA